jgi:hypothetical protein
MSHQLQRDVAEGLFAAWEQWDLDTIRTMLAEDAVDERPQPGERFVGRANIIGMYREVPGPPQITWRSVRGGPFLSVGEGTVEYGEAGPPCQHRRTSGGARDHRPLLFSPFLT